MYRETVILIFFVCVSKLLLWWHFYFVSVVLNLYKMLIMYIEGHLWGYTDYMAFCKTRLRTHSRLCISVLEIGEHHVCCCSFLYTHYFIPWWCFVRLYKSLSTCIIFAQKILSMPFYRYTLYTSQTHSI